jgi:TonB family protein
MRRFLAATFLVLFSALVFTPALFAQQDQTEATRKIVNRVTPHYPEMARSMNLKGSVRMDALVAPNGTVKSVEVKGGHPVLVQAAQHAIYKWKWAPASHETREPIEVKFNPEDPDGGTQ